MYYFIYGTIKNGGINSNIMLVSGECVATAHKIAGYEMYVIPIENIPFITPSCNPENRIAGEILKVDDEKTIRRLRYLEGYHPDIDPKYCLYLEKQVGEYCGEPLISYVWNREIPDDIILLESGEFDVHRDYR